MGAPQYEDGEMCWHPDGADVPPGVIITWLAMVAGVLAGVGWLIFQ